MKVLNKNEMRKVEGGSWKCKDCDKKFLLYIFAVTHQNCDAHYSGFSWCW